MAVMARPKRELVDPVERLPHCQRCAQHNLRSRLRGHKSACPFKECKCAKCLVVIERQKLMADQIKLRRLQKKQKVLMQQVAVQKSEERREQSPERTSESFSADALRRDPPSNQ